MSTVLMVNNGVSDVYLVSESPSKDSAVSVVTWQEHGCPARGAQEAGLHPVVSLLLLISHV